MANIYGEKSNLKVQWEKVKDGTPQQKFDWFVTYFGLYTVIGLALIALIIFLVVNAVKSNRPKILSGLLLDLYSDEGTVESLRLALCEKLELDEAKQTIDLTSLYSDSENLSNLYSQQQSVLARIAAGELDIIALTQENVSVYFDENDTDSSLFDPLTLHLEEDMLSALDAAGRLVKYPSEGANATPYFVQAAHTPLAEMMEILGDDFLIAVSSTTKNDPGIRAFLSLISE